MLRVLARLEFVAQRARRNFGLGIAQKANGGEQVGRLYGEPRARHGHRAADLKKASHPVVGQIHLSARNARPHLSFSLRSPARPTRSQVSRLERSSFSAPHKPRGEIHVGRAGDDLAVRREHFGIGNHHRVDTLVLAERLEEISGRDER